MFTRAADFSLRHRRGVLVVAGLFTVISAVIGMGSTKHLSEGGSDAPSEQAIQAADALQNQFHTGDSNFLIVVNARHGTVNDPSIARAGAILTGRLAHQAHVANVQSYWNLGDVAAMSNQSHTQALIRGPYILGNQSQIADREPAIAAAFAQVPGVVQIQIGGVRALVSRDRRAGGAADHHHR